MLWRRKRQSVRPNQLPLPIILPGVLEIKPQDVEEQEREQLRARAAQAIGISPDLLPSDTDETRQTTQLPPFPALYAQLKPANQSSVLKYYPHIRLLPLAKSWKPRCLLLSEGAPYLHIFKTDSPNEQELERLHITPNSVVFVPEQDGKRNLVKIGGDDVGGSGGSTSQRNHRDDGRTIWLLQVSDQAESHMWISTIKSLIKPPIRRPEGIDLVTASAPPLSSASSIKSDSSVIYSNNVSTRRLQAAMSLQPAPRKRWTATTESLFHHERVSTEPAAPARPPSIASVSTAASSKRWSRQQSHRLTPPARPIHPYAANAAAVPENRPQSRQSRHSDAPSYSRRQSVSSEVTISTTHSVVAPVAAAARTSRASMPPPPRPAPTSALPPAPHQHQQPQLTKSSRAFRLSLMAPKPPPSTNLPPRPDEKSRKFRPQRNSVASVPLSSPFPPPNGPLPAVPQQQPSKRHRLRILSAPSAITSNSSSSVVLPTPPGTPIGEKIIDFSNTDDSFLQMYSPALPSAPAPAAVAASNTVATSSTTTASPITPTPIRPISFLPSLQDYPQLPLSPAPRRSSRQMTVTTTPTTTTSLYKSEPIEMDNDDDGDDDDDDEPSELPKVLEQPEVEDDDQVVYLKRRKSLTPPHEAAELEPDAEGEAEEPSRLAATPDPPPKSLTPHLEDSKSDMIPLSHQGSVISLGFVSV